MKTYKCKYCGKEFDNIHALAGHIRMAHSSQKKRKHRARNNNMLSVPERSSTSSGSSASAKLTWTFKDGSKWIIQASPKVIELIKDLPELALRTTVVKLLKKHGLCTITIIEPDKAKTPK